MTKKILGPVLFSAAIGAALVSVAPSPASAAVPAPYPKNFSGVIAYPCSGTYTPKLMPSQFRLQTNLQINVTYKSGKPVAVKRVTPLSYKVWAKWGLTWHPMTSFKSVDSVQTVKLNPNKLGASTVHYQGVNTTTDVHCDAKF